ncbi:hypothetical protein [Shinella kummerowiae]|uniref:hypothetical protein n=1 Tax=Shinella kummerowiae TaxID=417745 RepID=UPI0021B55BC1|nr:hypothetical protein [Shinella kummerowiae]MCT7662339.1 hypothetical protein [Shinella kummerowiae]
MAKKTKQVGLAHVRAVTLDGIAEVEKARDITDPDANLERNGIKAGQWPGFPHGNMPPDCPITVLGMKGDTVYVISATGYLFNVAKWDHPTLVKLFTPYTNFLKWAWPAFTKAKGEPGEEGYIPPKVDRVARDKAVEAIITEAGRRGTFDPNENVRGRGGWTAGENYIWHSGKRIYFVEHVAKKGDKPATSELKAMQPGELNGCFYAQDTDTMAPWRAPIAQRDSVGHDILAHFMSWNWERPYLDPILMLGWVGAAFLGGALAHRPITFVTGGPGTGKSALQRYVRALFGSVMFATSNTTAAGIYQTIGHDSRPIAVDEFERKAQSAKETAIIEIARQAYSGDKGYRGGADGSSSEFQLNSAFFFSAILAPHLEQQDKTRMAAMQLNPLKEHGTTPVVQDYWGRMLLRQVMDGWQHFSAPDGIHERWRKRLSDPLLKFDSRAIDTYGTLLACADLLVGESGMIDAGMMADLKTPGKLDEQHLLDTLEAATSAERNDQVPKWLDVIERILGAKIEAFKAGERQTVGGVLEALEDTQRTDFKIEEARPRLALLGLGVRDMPANDPTNPCKGYALCIPHSDDGLNKLFADSEFSRGGWTQALRLGPSHIIPRDLSKTAKTVKINRAAKTCTLVDLAGYDAWVGR